MRGVGKSDQATVLGVLVGLVLLNIVFMVYNSPGTLSPVVYYRDISPTMIPALRLIPGEENDTFVYTSVKMRFPTRTNHVPTYAVNRVFDHENITIDLYDDLKLYGVSKFTNICITPSGNRWMIAISDPKLREQLGKHKCVRFNGSLVPMCRAFVHGMGVKIVNDTEVENFTHIPGNSLVLDPLIKHRHIGHMGYRIGSLFGVAEHLDDYGLDQLHNLVFPRIKDVASGSSDWSSELLSLVKSHPRLIDSQVLHQDPKGMCFSQAHFIRQKNRYFTFEDGQAWRRHTHNLGGKCPPQRIAFIDRGMGDPRFSRDAGNLLEAMELVSAYFNKSVEVVKFTPSMPLSEQRALMGSIGLLVSPHGSQLANLLFARPNTVVLETTSFSSRDHFAHLSEAMGLYYRNLASGIIPDDAEPRQRLALERCKPYFDMYTEDGDHGCNTFKDKLRLVLGPYNISLTALEMELAHSKQHLDSVCGHTW